MPKAWGCAYPHDVTSDTITNLPILGLVNEKDDAFFIRLYIRDTGNLKGLGRVHITVIDETQKESFSGSLSMYEDHKYGFQTIDFTIAKNKIAHSKIQIVANETKMFHSCVFFYDIPLSLLHNQFNENRFIPGHQTTSENTSRIQKFIGKKFRVDRKETPNQSTHSITGSAGSE